MENKKIIEMKMALSSIKELKLQAEENKTPFIILKTCDCLDYIEELESENNELIEANKRLINRISNATKEELLEFQEELSFERFIKGIRNEPI